MKAVRPETLTVEQTAAALGLSRNSTYAAVRSGEIPHLKIGSRILVPKAQLEQLLAGAANGNGKH